MAARGDTLVAIVPELLDWAIVRDQHWYRIPVIEAGKWAKKSWPPAWLAFYQPKVFGPEAFAVNYFCRVLDIREVYRWQLFPDQPRDATSLRRYYQVFLGPVQRLPHPIVSRRLRRILFIPTTFQKLMAAAEINDLFDDSPLEDRLWAELKRLRIEAQRQDLVQSHGRSYLLDFALYCAKGKLDVETDGDTWHTDPKRVPKDNLRDNDLETAGWSLLRFNTTAINEAMADYCLPTIAEKINSLGGIDEGRPVGRKISLDPDGPQQLGLFDRPSR